jgi:hypothetical protein
VLIGDSVWDVEAAKRAGIPCVCVLTGGFSDAELRDAGAAAVYGTVDELRDHLDALPVASRALDPTQRQEATVDEDLEGPMADTLEEASGDPDRQIGGVDDDPGPDVANPYEELRDDDDVL